MAAGGQTAVGSGLGATERRDAWWLGPLATAVALGSFGVYATFRAVYNAEYQLGVGTSTQPEHAYLLSPFYSPLIVLPWLAGVDFAGVSDPVGAGRISRHVLLLPQGVLPGVLSRSAGLRGG